MRRINRFFCRWLLLLFVGLLFLSGCSTQKLKSAGDQVNAYPALWRVTSDKGDAYLFGSFHLLPEGIRWYGDVIAAAFDSADQLVVESVDSPEESQQVMRFLEQKGMLPNGKTLVDYVDTETFEQLMQVARELDLSEMRVARSQPWFLTILFSTESLRRQGLEAKQGVDHLFIREAGRRDMKIIGLESTIEGLSSLAKEPLAVQIQQLKKNLAQKGKKSSALSELFEAWTRGDAQRIARLMRQGMGLAEYSRVLTERNHRWLPRVEKYLRQDKSSMIVVGAAHLTGEYSLLDLLKRKGYKIERLQ